MCISRAQAMAPWIPVLAMTATLTTEESKEVEENLCIREAIKRNNTSKVG